MRLRGCEQVGGEAAGVGGAGAAVVHLAGERLVAGGQLVDLLLQPGDRRVVLSGPRVRVVAGRAVTVRTQGSSSFIECIIRRHNNL